MPIIAVAVNRTGSGAPATSRSPIRFSNQKPGMIPITVSGMAAMMIRDRATDAVCIRNIK